MSSSTGAVFPRRPSVARLQPSRSVFSGLQMLGGSASTAGPIGLGGGGGFSYLSRSLSKESSMRVIRRSTCATFFGLLALALLAAAILDMYRGDDGARRYERLMSQLQIAAKACDQGLGRTDWRGNRIVSESLCLSHTGQSRLGEFPDAELRFFVIGDWGRDGMCCQHDVAKEMGVAGLSFNPSFVANVGDSFYPRGLKSVKDAQVDSSWRNVYSGEPGLSSLVWRSVLGNHDYRGDVAAQVELSAVEKLWHMPAKYYFQEEVGGSVLLAFLDTTPLYYDEDEMHQMDGAGESDQIGVVAARKRQRDEQISALEKALENSSAPVKIVFGHHPLYSSAENAVTESAHLKRMNAQLAGILSKHKVAAYFSGHEHTMEHTVAGGVHFFVIGTGSKVNPIQMRQTGSVFALGRQGFAAVAIEDTVVHVQFVDLTGHVVHAASIGPDTGGGMEVVPPVNNAERQ